jgi:hypothetical protein
MTPTDCGNDVRCDQLLKPGVRDAESMRAAAIHSCDADRTAIGSSRRTASLVGRWWAVFVLAAAWASPAAGVEVSEPTWGFDGRVRPHRFNVLTVTVDNPAPQGVEVELALRKWGGAGPVDAPIVERVFLGPGARRTVQFYPYISNDWGTWRLFWERQAIDIPQPRSSRRGARVLLDSAEGIFNLKGSIRRFPEAQFPPFVTATDSLQAVVLDHDPRWEEARRQAFLDWIYRGGAVFVLQDANGKYPQFPAAMSVLNSPIDAVSYGSGVIRKVAMTRNQLTRESAREFWKKLPNTVIPETTLEPGVAPPKAASSDDDDEDDAQQGFFFADGGNSLSARSFLDELKQMSRPEHNWLLLHAMFWVYILLIFPGCFLVGKQRNDFRVVYACLVGIVFVFSLAFGIVGQRGYGEATTVNSVAVVQPLPDGYLDVAQWSNAFATAGAIYDIRHAGVGTIYSACQDTEAVRGEIQNGGEARFQVDIPPFSSREFALRTKIKGTLPSVRVASITPTATGLSELTLSVDSSFPKTDEIYVLYRDRFYSAGRFDDAITLRSNVGAVPAFLRIEQNTGYYSPFGYMADERTAEARFRDMFVPLATRSLNIRSLEDARLLHWNPERLRLMYYADLLPELALQNKKFTNQRGKALYCLDLPIAAEAPPEKGVR